MIQFEIPGKVQAKQRHRMTKTGHSYTPKETVEYENWVRLCFQQVKCKMLEGELEAEIVAFMQIPKSASKAKKERMLNGEERPNKRPDLDNIAKSILDSLNGLAYKDDSQIVKMTVEKFWSDNPRVCVAIKQV